mmetsp:Transcript_37746/g.36201  ORF Transcript_37746/g.36201 Transcript_37746/m.36201 type:complete len:90 (-) Transcript_37746:394-663(-)
MDPRKNNWACAHHKGPCVQNILTKVVKSFLGGAGLKFLLTLLGSKFNVLKALKQYTLILRFGLVCAAFSFLYKASRCIIKKLEIPLSLD